MTISSTNRKAGPFTGNGVTVAFPFTFKVFTTADVLVVQAVTATGVETVQTLGANYTVVLNADQSANPGGTITALVAPPTGTTLTATSQVGNLQPMDLTNAGGFYPKVLNDAMDRATVQIQQLAEKVSRALKTALSTPAGVSADLPPPAAYKVLAWNSTGTALENTDPALSSALATNLAAPSGSLLVTHLPDGFGAVATSVQSYLRSLQGWHVNVKDAPYYAKGDGVTNDTAAIQAAIDYVKNLPLVTNKPAIFCPGGRYLITATLQLADNIALEGVKRDIGYWYGFNHSSEIIASGTMNAMIDVTGSNVYVGHLGLYGNSSTNYGLYTAGTFGRASSNTFEHLAITLCNKTGIYLNAIGITKMSHLQISGCLECGIDGSGWGDADLQALYINTINQDSTSTVNEPSSAVTMGIGIRIRANVATGAQSGNINIRGGKIEFCRIGILINAGQGINISGINFDTCRRAGIYINSDNLTAYPNITNSNLLSCTSIQITGCRFVGGLMSGSQTPSAHIFAAYCRYVTISGNGFKRGNDTAIDFGGYGGAQGPSYGIYLYNAEECTVVGNDLYGAAITNCLRIEHATPANAQHTVSGNNLDGTEAITVGTVKNQSLFGNLSFTAASVPIAKNTAKAWVKFNGQTLAIYDSFNVASVTNPSAGNYNINFINPMGNSNYMTLVTADPYGTYSTAGLSSTANVNNAAVISTINGTPTNAGTMNVLIFGA